MFFLNKYYLGESVIIIKDQLSKILPRILSGIYAIVIVTVGQQW